jgi:hypothetical protein
VLEILITDHFAHLRWNTGELHIRKQVCDTHESDTWITRVSLDLAWNNLTVHISLKYQFIYAVYRLWCPYWKNIFPRSQNRYPGFQSLRDISIYYLLSKALESRVQNRPRPKAKQGRDKMTNWWTRSPCPSRLSHWRMATPSLFLIAINDRITSELLARNRRITDKNTMWTMFS